MLHRIKKAFTLVEVIIVVIILGIIASFALPRYTTVVERSRSNEGVQILMALLGAQRRHALENGSYKAGTGAGGAIVDGDLDIDIPVPDNFAIPVIINNPNNVASITRTGLYTLSIDEDGTITCADIGANTFCARMGY